MRGIGNFKCMYLYNGVITVVIRMGTLMADFINFCLKAYQGGEKEKNEN